MKNLKRTVVILSVISSFIFIRCTPNMDNESSTKDIITQGQWTVAYYYAGHDRTADYNNCSINFNGNGTVAGTNGTYTFSGTWNTVHDVSRNEVLAISMESQSPNMADLNEQWIIVDKSQNNLILKDAQSAQLQLSRR